GHPGQRRVPGNGLHTDDQLAARPAGAAGRGGGADPGRPGRRARRDRGRGRAAGLRPAGLHDRPPAGGRRRHVRAVTRGRDPMTGTLAGRVAVVTGAGSGIGRAAAVLFAREGAVVAAVDLAEAAAKETVAQITGTGGRALAAVADVSDPDQVSRAFDGILRDLGRVDVLYNNAGVNSSGSVMDATDEDWDRCFAVNAKGTFLCSRAAARPMVAAGRGSIINQGSVAAVVGVANFAS